MSTDPRSQLRSARAELEKAEARVMELEQRIAELTAALNDPELYTRSEGVAQARQRGSQLDRLQRELDAAMERWTAAQAAVDVLVPPA